MLYHGTALPASIDRGGRGLQQLLRRLLVRQAEHRAGRIQAGMGAKPRCQDGQVGVQTFSGADHGAARSEQRVRVNR
jgi:hypothetical protein